MNIAKLIQDIQTECSEARLAIREQKEDRAERSLQNACRLINLYFERKAKNAKAVDENKA